MCFGCYKDQELIMKLTSRSSGKEKERISKRLFCPREVFAASVLYLNV